MKHSILLQHNYVELMSKSHDSLDSSIIGTLVSNMAHYGFCPNKKLFQKIEKCSLDEITLFWHNLEPALAKEKATDKDMNEHVVYKNFPSEVLSMNDSDYWFNQIMMYVGLNEFVEKENKKPRLKSLELKDLRALSLSDDDTLPTVFKNNLSIPNDWTTNQLEQSTFLLSLLSIQELDLSDFSFKLNAISLASYCLNDDVNISLIVKDATDVIRLAVFMSGYDDGRLVSGVRFKKFKRSERRFFLNLLENSKNLEADIALNKKVWKGFLTGLHPSDYKFARVTDAFDKLYNNKLRSFQGKVDTILKATFPDFYRKKLKSSEYFASSSLEASLDIKTVSALKEIRAKAKPLPFYFINEQKKKKSLGELMTLFKSRPGEFLRQFHMLYGFFGDKVTVPFSSILPKLSVSQLLKFKLYIDNINNRESLIYAPNGQWSKANFVDNEKSKISNTSLILLRNEISVIISHHVNDLFPEGVKLDNKLKNVKLQTNSQELSPYGRGTRFPISDNITFIRSGSYWQSGSEGNIWYDNGWNFFGENWESKGSVCWNNVKYRDNAAIFSGDPTTSKTKDGKACQMIDLYIDKLLDSGVRYAVWNILGYSGKSFSEAKEVIASLQLGEVPSEDEIYDPSKAHMVFPLTGSNLTKYISFIDLKSREIVYLDANLYGNIMSADMNEEIMSERMPDMIEYLDSLPSVYDLLEHAEEGTIPFLFDDKDNAVTEERAYVFNPLNNESDFKKIDLVEILK